LPFQQNWQKETIILQMAAELCFYYYIDSVEDYASGGQSPK
jgi:hypothetical protein